MQQIARSITLAYNNLPRLHRVMLGSLTIITLAISIGRPLVYQHNSINNKVTEIIHIDHKKSQILTPEASEPLDTLITDDEISTDELDDKPENNYKTYDYLITMGDNLSNILTNFGIDKSEIFKLIKQYPILSNLKIGQTISCDVNHIGELQQLFWKLNRCETRTYSLINGRFKEFIKSQQGNENNKIITGSLNGSFVNSARNAGLTLTEVNMIIKVLQWQMDFRKLQKGDQFAVLIARKELNSYSKQSQLLGVRMHTNGKDYYAVRAEDGKFYDLQGSGLVKRFMRFPTIKKFRISSNFNPRRIHPITGHIAPHRGVDFAMPVGTPIFAIGDGKVVVAKNGGAAGNYIVIRHSCRYTTRFMHLNKILVKPGQQVKRGERIALSGNTGRSTGPHLHYEFWLNNQAINPLTVQLPRTDKLLGKNRQEYLDLVGHIILQLKN
ncbi:Murein DD-endopeptidase MepM [Candidatus Profftia lariciata]|uniref:murein DD-endopeptidase MepM n=1 Tax=Candidatus Profftia lariciata TaxID=1987921 RepID=UPI001D034320|nr:murein DD-endopeptidase MepM [Candidatus Profftia lariciata]UDG81611.1 Murein DD-endopeptidase MepM [Candidatus Profftia lariciata]